MSFAMQLMLYICWAVLSQFNVLHFQMLELIFIIIIIIIIIIINFKVGRTWPVPIQNFNF
jgi:hypothetical protein